MKLKSLKHLAQIWVFLLALAVPLVPRGTALPPETQNSPWELVARKPLSLEQTKLVAYLSEKYNSSGEYVERIVRASYYYAVEAGLSPFLVLAVIEKESSLRVDAVSHYGAVGLMQVVPRYHGDKLEEGHPVEQLKNPETNIKVGTQIMAEYLAMKKGNVEKALKKYSGNARSYLPVVRKYEAKLKKEAKST